MDESVWVIERKGKKRKTYHVRWLDPATGKQRSISCGSDRRRANSTAAVKRQDLAAGIDTDVRRVPWAQFKKAVLDAKRVTTKQSTMTGLERTLELFEESVQPRSADRLRYDDCVAFFAARKAAEDSESTRDKHRRNLRLLFNVGIRLRYLRNNPIKGVERFKAAKKDWHLYEPKEVDAILRHADRDLWWPLVYMAYTTALRKCELLYLTWADVDLKGKVAKVASKSGKDLIPWTTKSHERRIVPLTDDLVDVLRKRKVASDPDNPYVLLPTDRYQHLLAAGYAGRDPVNNFTRSYQRLCKDAEVPVDEFHSLRRSRTTLWLEEGVPPHTVQRLCGHAKIETTIEYYSKVRTKGIDLARKVASDYVPDDKIIDDSLTNTEVA